MRKIALFIAAILVATSSFAQFAQKELINVLLPENGAYMVTSPDSYSATNKSGYGISNWSPQSLIDKKGATRWCSPYGDELFPYEFVFELSEQYWIHELGFDNSADEGYPGISAKEVEVSFSTQSAEEGFGGAIAITLEENAPMKYISLDQQQKARWVKVTILSNYGNKEYTELAEIEALGSFVKKQVNTPTIDGDWDTNWNGLTFVQDGASFTGNYVWDNGVISNGVIDRRKIYFDWDESDGGKGKVILTINEEGDKITGIWCYGNDFSDYGYWIFERESTIIEDAVIEDLIEDSVNKPLPVPDIIEIEDISADARCICSPLSSDIIATLLTEVAISDNPDTVIEVQSETTATETNATTIINQSVFTDWTVYPNPTNGYLTTTFKVTDASSDVRIAVLDNTGAVVKTIHNNYSSGMQQAEFNLTDLPAGIYFLRMETKQGYEVQRIINTGM